MLHAPPATLFAPAEDFAWEPFQHSLMFPAGSRRHSFKMIGGTFGNPIVRINAKRESVVLHKIAPNGLASLKKQHQLTSTFQRIAVFYHAVRDLRVRYGCAVGLDDERW